ncbi:carnitine dehydratase [Brevibacterium luteolum]|uniref:Carnitine dehydratase n=2 Tax=Brevibacterium luteolum TaxID=199591 RepID=A0A2N6PJV8_9MICO|nr:carnitine dehydratase [Brevibacterium luteolum]
MAPYAGKILKDMGAEVIKMEPPDGDIGRRIGMVGRSGISLLSLNLNAGKKSIVVDASDPGEAETIRRLVGWADVIITNLLPSRREAFGLDWESVEKVDPATILVTGQGFSSVSERRDDPAYDDIVQAAAGIADTYRLRDGAPGYSPYVVADKVCGMSMVQGALAALYRRGTTGVGEWVDVPMVDTVAAFTLVEHLGGDTTNPSSGEVGWSRVLSPAHKPHRALDGWVCVMPYTDANWERFCRLIGRVDYLEHPDLRTNARRSAKPETYEAVLADYARTRTCDEIEAECRTARIPVQRVNEIRDLTRDEYIGRQPMITRSTHHAEGPYLHIGSPLQFAGASRPPVEDCSELDADRDEVLRLIERDSLNEIRTPNGSSRSGHS